MSKKYTVSDGKLVLTLRAAEEGGYIVTSPLDPDLITEGEDLAEAFANARDALKALAQTRAKLPRSCLATASERIKKGVEAANAGLVVSHVDLKKQVASWILK